ncbi:MAG: phosphoribosylformylglycinamidine synthase subunit PurQ [Myxococcales bacterium]|jgi:phosphoribosylformylglycinamidine synthase|nr:phosphoribosylformylglycinamidine synthase subunit PurQ [Myxococcales bacterium]
MSLVRCIVLTGNGISSEMETAHACQLAGADEVQTVFLWDLASGKASLDAGQLLVLPGGFLDGDDLGAAHATAIRLRHTQVNGQSLFEQLQAFAARGGLMLGIGNGFQLMVKLGLLPALGDPLGTPQVALATNLSGRFEDRWVTLKADPESPCVFTRDIDQLELPVRHVAGRLIAPEDVLSQLQQQHLAPLLYAHPLTGDVADTHPHNPDGSALGMAALCDATGRLFGMMPHPEGFLHRTHHPRWTREERPEEGDGLAIFRNAISYIRDNM